MAPSRDRVNPLQRLEADRPHIQQGDGTFDEDAHYSDTGRIKGLSDGVFSIAMTLLVLELAIPEALGPGDVGERFRHLLPTLGIYFLTFIVLGGYWVFHTIQFHYVIRADRPLMVITVLFLAFVSLVPFTTSFLSSYPREPLAISTYCGNLIAIGLVMNAGLLWATRDPIMVSKALNRTVMRYSLGALMVPPLLFGLAIVISFVYWQAAYAICIAVPILSFLPNPLFSRFLFHFAEREGSP